MITQEDANTYARVIKWGCLAPICVGILLCIAMYIIGLFIDTSDKGFVSELNLHYKIDSSSYDMDDGRRIYQARLYFSRTDSFGSDYIDFHFTEVNYPQIYYIEPDTFYIIDRNSWYIQDIISKDFSIQYISRTDDDYLHDRHKIIENEDSVLRARSYKIALYNFCNVVTVFDKKGKIIYDKNFKFF